MPIKKGPLFVQLRKSIRVVHVFCNHKSCNHECKTLMKASVHLIKSEKIRSRGTSKRHPKGGLFR